MKFIFAIYIGMADLFASISDDAINRIIRFARDHAPYLFNYVAPSITAVTRENSKESYLDDLWLVCSPVPDPAIKVPKYRRLPPFVLPGIPVELPYSIQIIDLKLDFHPSDAISLPAELSFSLNPQHFALEAKLHFGMACAPPEVMDHYYYRRIVSVLPVTDLVCFAISIAATGHLIVTSRQPPGDPSLLDEISLEIDQIEIINIKPEGLENVIECYLIALLRNYVLPQLILSFQRLAVNAIGLTDVTPNLTPGLTHNPAIEQNELRIWLDVKL